MKRTILLILALSVILNGLIERAQASQGEVIFQTAVTKIAPGSEFEVNVLINSGIPINTLDLRVAKLAALVQLVGFDNQNSIVNIGQTNGTFTDGTIVLRGGILPAYQGSGGKVVGLIFKALTLGNLTISLTSGKLYLANGQGTLLPVYAQPLSLVIAQNGTQTNVVALTATTAPELSVQIVKEPVGQTPLLVFNATDKTGVNFTALRSENWFSWSPWQLVQNPVVLPSGAWRVELQAVSGAGLTTMQTIYLWPEIIKRMVVLAVLILIFWVGLLFYNKFRRRI